MHIYMHCAASYQCKYISIHKLINFLLLGPSNFSRSFWYGPSGSWPWRTEKNSSDGWLAHPVSNPAAELKTIIEPEYWSNWGGRRPSPPGPSADKFSFKLGAWFFKEVPGYDEAGYSLNSFFRLHNTTQALTTHTHSHFFEHTYANSTPMNIFEDWAGKSSRLTKSPQAPRCRRERRLPLNAQRR